MTSDLKSNIVKIITIIYFANALIEVISEYYSNNILIFLAKPLIPFLLIVLYWFSSERKNPLYIIIMLFSLITNVLFIPKTPLCLFYGVVAFTIHRILLIYYVSILSKIKNIKLFVAVTIPLLAIFFYLFFASTDIPENSYVLLIFLNILGAILGGIGISNYILHDNKQNSLLMISVLMFLGLQMVVYVERYYLASIMLEYVRPLAMLLNVLAFFTFYKYVIAAESNNNRSAL